MVMSPREFDALRYRQRFVEEVAQGLAPTLDYDRPGELGRRLRRVRRCASDARSIVEGRLDGDRARAAGADRGLHRRRDPAAAAHFVDALLDVGAGLAASPLRGRTELPASGLREVVYERYRIVDRVNAKRIEILTVFEGTVSSGGTSASRPSCRSADAGHLSRVEPIEIELPSRRATRRLGAALAKALVPGDIVWLEGELGAGKTFFTRGLLRALGVPQSVPVTSPTFALIHEHEGRAPIRHLDLYRLGDASELHELGIDEVLEHAVTIIEWGARFRDAIGERGVEIALDWRGDHARLARVRGFDPRGEELARAACDCVCNPGYDHDE